MGTYVCKAEKAPVLLLEIALARLPGGPVKNKKACVLNKVQWKCQKAYPVIKEGHFATNKKSLAKKKSYFEHLKGVLAEIKVK